MRIGLCQPYLFPYIGYYQLVNCVDIFVIYDDVNFSKNKYGKGNTILSNGKPLGISMPVIEASSYKKYNELLYKEDVKKICKTIEYSYVKSDGFKEFFPVVSEVLNGDDRRLSVLNTNSIVKVFEWAGYSNLEVVYSSDLVYDMSASASDKIIDIVGALNGTEYINPIGGMDLYDNDYFADNGIRLQFLRTLPRIYPQQKSDTFVENLSVIDMCMNLDRSGFVEHLDYFELVDSGK